MFLYNIKFLYIYIYDISVNGFSGSNESNPFCHRYRTGWVQKIFKRTGRIIGPNFFLNETSFRTS